MKNEKGFTLVELLAVVAILITVITIISPKIIKSFQTSEDAIYKSQINALISSARIYMNENYNLLPEENEELIITIDDLKKAKLIKKEEVLNPKTKQPLPGCVKVSFKNNKYNYDYIEEEKCNL